MSGTIWDKIPSASLALSLEFHSDGTHTMNVYNPNSASTSGGGGNVAVSTGNPNADPRQFNLGGSVLWGNDPKTGKPIEHDCGEFQINTWAHAAELAKLGLDVCHSEADKEAYAPMLVPARRIEGLGSF